MKVEMAKEGGDVTEVELLYERWVVITINSTTTTSSTTSTITARCLIACALYEQFWLSYVSWWQVLLLLLLSSSYSHLPLLLLSSFYSPLSLRLSSSSLLQGREDKEEAERREEVRRIFKRSSKHLPTKVDLHTK